MLSYLIEGKFYNKIWAERAKYELVVYMGRNIWQDDNPSSCILWTDLRGADKMFSTCINSNSQKVKN